MQLPNFNIKIALLQSSTKPFEKRIPLHPEHFSCIDQRLRKYLYFEENYSTNFGYPDSYHEQLGYKTEERSKLISSADCSLMVRPMPLDVLSMKKNSMAVGWFHCVQYKEMVEAAITNKITLICMEMLYNEQKYFFEENSKISGKLAVTHAIQVANITAEENPTCIVIGHGNAGIAALEALKSLKIKNIICCSKRNEKDIINKVAGVVYKKIKHCNHTMSVLLEDNTAIIELLKQAHIIVNATAQNIYEPAMFLHKNDLKRLKKDTLIIDVSCDKHMGFEFGTVTSLSNPIIHIENILYYAIDHLPTLDYDNASKAISSKIITILPDIIDYLTSAKHSAIIERAIHINRGVIINPDIEYFQKHFLQADSLK